MIGVEYEVLLIELNVTAIACLAGPAEQAKDLESDTEDLKAAVTAVVEVWKKKLLPDW